MTTQAWPPPDDDPKAPWRAVAPSAEGMPGHLRCVYCDRLVPVTQAALDYGLDSHGRLLGLGVCRACAGRLRMPRGLQ
jgi:hypothetical protein